MNELIKNMKIRTRMLVSYSAIIALTIISSAVSIWMLKSIGSSLDTFYNQQFQIVNEAWSARSALYGASSDIMQSMLEEREADTQTVLKSADEKLQTMNASLARIHELAQTEAGKSVLKELDSTISQAASYRKQIYELAGSNRNREAFNLATDNYIPLLNQARDQLTQLSDLSQQSAFTAVSAGNRSVAIAVVILASITVLSVLIAVVLSLYISRSIRIPIKELQGAGMAMARGDLKTDITYHSKDELGDLADGLRNTIVSMDAIISDIDYCLSEMADGNFNIKTKAEDHYVGDFANILAAIRRINTNLSETLSQINVSSDEVYTSSEQVSVSAQALSQGATQQASSIEELAATIGLISEQVQTTAHQSQTVKEKAGTVGTEMEESNAQMKQMIQAMSEISESSTEIGKIIKTIEDISFQTNILALNAAVEAARAGAAGKGFAVVADEVRNLANKSAEASQNTSALIESSIRAVQHGTQIADTTAQYLSRAVTGSEEIVSAIDSITEASNNQAVSISQVRDGIEQIAGVVQTNSATAEESAASSEELSGQSQVLKDLVSRFTLKDEAFQVLPPSYTSPVKKEQPQPNPTPAPAAPVSKPPVPAVKAEPAKKKPAPPKTLPATAAPVEKAPEKALEKPPAKPASGAPAPEKKVNFFKKPAEKKPVPKPAPEKKAPAPKKAVTKPAPAPKHDDGPSDGFVMPKHLPPEYVPPASPAPAPKVDFKDDMSKY